MSVNKMLLFLLLLFPTLKGIGQGDTLHGKTKEVICHRCYVVLGRKDSCELEQISAPGRVDSGSHTDEIPRTKKPDDSLITYYTRTYIYNYGDSFLVRQTFNRQWQLIEKLTFDSRAHPDTSIFIRILYLYDSKARLARELILGRNNEIASEKSYEYGAAGVLKYHEDAPGLKTTILYNANGSMREIEVFDPFSKNTAISKFVYDGKRELLIRREEYTNGKMAFYRKYEYKE